jgi:glucosyl-3-phosphoglycerate synthase
VSDVYQTGSFATLHRLKSDNLLQLERDFKTFSSRRPIALVLPALYEEFARPAMSRIREELTKVHYLNEIVVTLGQASEEQFHHAQRFFADMPERVRIIWNNGPRISQPFQKLAANGLTVGAEGKGRASWLAYGNVIAKRQAEIITLHDCDIKTYSREILARV